MGGCLGEKVTEMKRRSPLPSLAFDLNMKDTIVLEVAQINVALSGNGTEEGTVAWEARCSVQTRQP